METNYSQETVDTLLGLYEFRIDILEDKIKQLNEIIKINDLI